MRDKQTQRNKMPAKNSNVYLYGHTIDIRLIGNNDINNYTEAAVTLPLEIRSLPIQKVD